MPLRLVALEVKMRGLSAREDLPDATLFIPEQIMKMIPKYRPGLQRVTEGLHYNMTVAISETRRHSPAEVHSLAHVIQLLGGVAVPEIPCTSLKEPSHLSHLVQMYDRSIALEIESAEKAILDYIEYSNELPVSAFLEFAKTVYNDDYKSWCLPKHGVESSIGQMLRRKLTKLLPTMMEDGTVQNIQSDGGTLSNELLRIIIDASERKQSIKAEPANNK